MPCHRLPVLTVLVAALSPPLPACGEEIPVLDEDWNGVVKLSEERAWQSWQLDLPEDLAALELTLAGEGEADLYLRRGEPMDEWNQADFHSIAPGASEHLLLRADEFEEGLGGYWFLDVASSRPTETEARLEVDLLGRLELADLDVRRPRKSPDSDILGEPAGILEEDTELEVEFGEEGESVLYALRVDSTTERIIIDLDGSNADAGTDVDLRATYAQTPTEDGRAHHASTGYEATEHLEISRSSTPGLSPGIWYLEVVPYTGEPDSLPLSVRFERREGEPEPLRAEPSAETDVHALLNGPGSYRLDFRPGESWRQLAFDLPEDVTSLRATTAGGRRDVDLFLLRGQPSPGGDTSEAGNALVDSDYSYDGEETVFLDADSEAGFEPGRHYLLIENLDVESTVEDLVVTLAFDVAPSNPLPVEAGTWSHQVMPRGRDRQQYLIELPEGVSILRVAALNATRDVDLFLRQGSYVNSDGAEGYDYEQVTNRLSEWLEIEAGGDDTLEPGVWYIEAASLIPEDTQTEFDLLVTFDEEIPFPDLPALPLGVDRELDPLEHALQAVVRVDVDGGHGSGTLLSPAGHVLTNWHVVFDETTGAVQEEGIFVSISDPARFDEPPVQLYRARLIDADREADIALLEITGDIYERPLPQDYTFPYARLADPETLRHGQPLFITGYPSTGGEESRASITATSGIVSGFNTDADGRRITLKTDAKINAGNSGGAVFLPDGRYIATPHSELIEADDELGFAAPVRIIPEDWQEILRQGGGEIPWAAGDEVEEPEPTVPVEDPKVQQRS